MYSQSVLPLFAFLVMLLHVSVAVPDEELTEECETRKLRSDFVAWKPGSKYLIQGSGKRKGSWDIDDIFNGNFLHYNDMCRKYKMEMPIILSLLDFKTLEGYAIEVFNTPLYQKYYQQFEEAAFLEKTALFIFGLGMKYDNEPSGGSRVGSIILGYESTPYVLWAGENPLLGSYIGRVDILLGLTLIRGPDGKETYRATNAASPAYSGFNGKIPFKKAVFPLVCMYKTGSDCFNNSVEEQGTATVDKEPVFKLTDAFRGEWFMSNFMLSREDGREACKTVNAAMFSERIYGLPWTKGKTFRWDLNRIFYAYQDALRKKFELFPFVGFHGRENHEYFFEYNKTRTDENNRQAVYSMGFQPQLVERKTQQYAERFCLCYRPYECESNGRKRRDLRSQRNRQKLCAKRG